MLLYETIWHLTSRLQQIKHLPFRREGQKVLTFNLTVLPLQPHCTNAIRKYYKHLTLQSNKSMCVLFTSDKSNETRRT